MDGKVGKGRGWGKGSKVKGRGERVGRCRGV